mgnify:CR=1 FL=1
MIGRKVVEDDRITEIICCPKCGSNLQESTVQATELSCLNKTCGYMAARKGNFLNLLPKHLDNYQQAEHRIRKKLQQALLRQLPGQDQEDRNTLSLLAQTAKKGRKPTIGYRRQCGESLVNRDQ